MDLTRAALPLPWRGWVRLPREARDTLFLLAVIGWTVLPHLSHLPLWCSMLTGSILVWRAWLALSNAALPSRWWLVAVLLLACGLTLWSHRTLVGRESGVTLVVVLMALKTLELRARRDAFVVFFLGFFLVLTQFFYSQSLLVAFAMLVSVWGLLTALVLAHMPVGQPALRQAAWLSARSALWGTPLMVLLFVLFPRIGPLWGVQQDRLGKTGLSSTMRMGSMAELAADESVAMRVRFLGTAPPPEALYFRGPVLAQFDGREWTPLPPSLVTSLQPLADLRTSGPSIAYEMTLEPQRIPLLPLLEAAPAAPEIDGYRVRVTEDLQWYTDQLVFERLRFTARAHLTFQHGPLRAVPGLQHYLELPFGANPRTLAWARAMRRQSRYAQADVQELAALVLQRISQGGYTYSLTPGVYGEDGGLDAVDEFWLDRKIGFCEHYAAAFVVVMRAFGVPARVVTGYQGADTARVEGYTIVRQSHAHAWAEYWRSGSGWLRTDPTAAVAPDRILRSRNLQPEPGLMASALGEFSPALLQRFRTSWEALNNRWNQWVLNYSQGQQFDLMKSIGFTSPSWHDLALLLIAVFCALSVTGAAWAWWEQRRQDPWIRQFAQARRALRTLGLSAQSHDPPRVLAERVRARFGEHGASLAELLYTMEQQHYGRKALNRPPASLTRALRLQARYLQVEAR